MKFATGTRGIDTSRCRCSHQAMLSVIRRQANSMGRKKGGPDSADGAGGSQVTDSNRLADHHRHPARNSILRMQKNTLGICDEMPLQHQRFARQ